ncbi:MAG: PP2C family protein-serine/threonine phosphatase [Egibacteraceae bacterium]
MEVHAAAATHVGHVRDSNEDSVHAGEAVYAVADGLGGHAAGEVASAIAVATVAGLDEGGLGHDQEEARSALVEAVRQANRAVHHDARRNAAHEGMGTTLTVAAVHNGSLLIAHVGDSRAYLLRQGRARQLTTDHATGPFTLTRVVGLEPEVAVDSYNPVPLQDGDAVLLCSDGLTAVVTDDELAGLLRDRRPREAADVLVKETLARGAPDNVAVVVLAVGDADR